MSAVAFAIGTSVVGGGVQAYSARKAAKTQAAAADRATEAEMQMYNQSREDQEPWRKAGQAGLNEIAAMLGLPGYEGGNWQADPGYEFQRSEGEKGINRAISARGGLVSGAALKALGRYNQDYASNAYDRRFNRLASIADVGQNAANMNSQNAMATGGRMAENIVGAGNARASGYVGVGNALTGALGSGLDYYQGAQALDAYKQANKLGKYGP